MRRKPQTMRPVGDRNDAVIRQHAPAAPVVRVFQAHQPRADHMVVAPARQMNKLIEPHHAVVSLDGSHRHAAELCVGRLLVVVNVAADLANEFVAGRTVQPHADLVRHAPRRHEDRRLFSQHPRDAVLQPMDRRILVENIIADLRRGHRRAHLGGWSRHRVAAKLDRAVGHKCRALFEHHQSIASKSGVAVSTVSAQYGAHRAPYVSKEPHRSVSLAISGGQLIRKGVFPDTPRVTCITIGGT